MGEDEVRARLLNELRARLRRGLQLRPADLVEYARTELKVDELSARDALWRMLELRQVELAPDRTLTPAEDRDVVGLGR